MIDLHTHSTASDGTDEPAELIEAASRAGLTALAVTDHDTFAGSDAARPLAAAANLRFMPALELSTRILEQSDPAARNAHLLAYFPSGPTPEFREWLESLRTRRRARNRRLAERLQALGLEVTLEEAEAHGRNITGRPHFARVLRDKGYVRDWEEAFSRYLGERGAAYVEREDPTAAEGLGRVRAAGGVASLAHLCRMGKFEEPGQEELLLRSLVDAGLGAIEIWHSDHEARHVARYNEYARQFCLVRTGGSDYHGANKREVQLGCGRLGPLPIPLSVFDDLCEAAVHSEG